MNARTASPFLARRLGGTAVAVAALFAASVLPMLPPPAHGESDKGLLTGRPLPAVRAVKPLAVGAEVRTSAGQRRRVLLPEGTVVYVNEKTTATLTAARELTLDAGEVYVEAAPDRDAAFVLKAPKRRVSARGTRFAVRAGDGGTGVLVASGKVKVSGIETPLTAGQQLAPGSDKPAPAPRASHLLSWTRDLMAAAAPLVPASEHAGGSLEVTDPDGRPARLALRKYHVDVHIEDGFARTTIDQTYFNHTAERLEGTFYFPLPPDASLSRLAMYVNGERMEGGMVERDRARNVYETVVYQQRDPALLEWVDGSTFKMRVFPLEPRQEKRVILSYSQRLPGLYGQWSYRFPAGHTLGGVRDWSFHGRVKNGAALPWHSPSHALKAARDGADLLLDVRAKNAKLDRDVVLTVGATDANPGAQSVRFSSARQGDARYLMLRYRPGLPSFKERTRRDWVFLFESSGDRDPLLARAQVEVIRGLLANAEPDDTFAVLTAGTRTRALAKGPQPVTPANVQAAVAFLEGAHLIGALDLDRALTDAAAYLAKGKSPYLVHVGSGIAALGERRADVLAKRLPEGARYVGVGVGRRWDRAFMKATAERTGGYFTQINPDETIAWRAFDLAATLNTPRLLDVTVADRAGKVRLLPFASSLAQGEELGAVARIDGGAKDVPEEVVVRGTLDGRPFEGSFAVKDVAEGADYLPRTWARLEIERLLAADAAKNKDAVVALSKAMYVMTPFTSLLVLEDEAMYTRFKVDRGRKDHWAVYACPAKVPVVYEPEDGAPGDPRQGIKPSARRVVKSIAVRQAPRVLAWPEGVTAAAFSPDGRTVLAGEIAFPNGEGKHDGIARSSEELSGLDVGGPPILSKLPYLNREGRAIQQMRKASKAFDELGRRIGRPLDDSKLGGMRAIPPEQAVPGEIPSPYGLLRGRRPDDLGINYYNLVRPEKLEAARALGATSDANDWQLGLRRNVSVSGRMRQLEKAILGDDQPDAILRRQREESVPAGSLLYRRPGYSGDDRLFFDLLSYAPGLNTTTADVLAVLEAEAFPTPDSKRGTVAPAARALFAKARPDGWHALTLPGGLTITFDGSGRYAYERTLPSGLRERAVCDGTTLQHLYPDLGLAARRAVSRFHRLAFARRVPWALPGADDLARGCDLRAAGERTVALVPHGAGDKGRDGKVLPYAELRFVFSEDGPLAERQIVEMPSGKVLLRTRYAADGTVRVLDADGKELGTRKLMLRAAKAPNLKADTRKLVVLALPYRTRQHVLKSRGIEKTRYEDLRFDDARALLAADVAEGRGDQALDVFRRALHGRDQRQLGYYVLLASCGQNLDSEHADVQGEHPHDPLAQYLALYSSPVLRKHASQWAAGSKQWGDGFLGRLALSHALCQRWQSGKATAGTDVQRRAERKRALDYVRTTPGTSFAWALLGLMQDRTRDEANAKKDVRDAYADLAGAWRRFEKVPGLAYAARYEHARCLYYAGQRPEARKAFLALYQDVRKESALPRIDADFRRALLGSGKDEDEWGGLLRRTAANLVKHKRRATVLILAKQCWQLDDAPLANHLLAAAREGITDAKERRLVDLAALRFLMDTSQWAEADHLLRKLLPGAKEERAALWRVGVKLAEERDMPARALECLEQALDAEYAHLPAFINVEQVGKDYGKLLTHYQELAQALVTLKLPEPAGFRAKVVRAADRWRSLDRRGDQACELAGRVLQTLGDKELVWDYLTTPVGMHPNEAGPWAQLARSLARRGDLGLADRAYAAAFAAEPTDAQLLWDRAENLRQAGRLAPARGLYRQLAEGKWQPRFAGLQTQARWQLEKP